jgi:hypothetical protein
MHTDALGTSVTQSATSGADTAAQDLRFSRTTTVDLGEPVPVDAMRRIGVIRSAGVSSRCQPPQRGSFPRRRVLR